MNILYVTTRFTALSHTFITREVDQLRRAGHRVELLALNGEEGEASAGSPECDLSGMQAIHPVPRSRVLANALGMLARRPGRFLRAVGVAMRAGQTGLRGKFRLLYQLLATTTKVAWAEGRDLDHIHAHFANPATNYALFLHLLTGIPYSFTGHAADLYRDRSAMDIKLAHAAGAVAISEYNLRYYRQICPQLERIDVVHCGIHPDAFPFRSRPAPTAPLQILAVGRCTTKKGFTHLLDALAVLQREGVAHQATLVGYGELLPALQEQSRSLELQHLEFTGAVQQDRIRELMDQADVFVLPCVEAPDGDIDGIPVVLMEAMASGCPVISTAVSGIPELVRHGETGLVVPPHDHEALAVAMRSLLDDPDLAPRLSAAGRQHVEAEFNLVENGRQLDRFFRSLQEA